MAPIVERFPMNPRGFLVCDPRHAQVAFDYRGVHLLGDVREAFYDEVTGCQRLRVTHFNGEPWPIDPPHELAKAQAKLAELAGPPTWKHMDRIQRPETYR